MIYLVLSIVISIAVVITFRLFNKFNINNLQAITFNYIVACSFGYITIDRHISIHEIVNLPWLIYPIIIGTMFITVFNIFALSTQKVGVAITAVSSKMSVVLPVLLGIIIFRDNLNLLKISGIIFALFAFYLTFKKDDSEPVDKRYIFLPILLFLGNGINDITMSYTKKTFGINSNGDVTLMLNIIFTTSLVIGITAVTISLIRGRAKIHFRNLIAGSILGFFNYGSTFYFLKALESFDNSVFFPVFNVAIVSLSAIVGFIFFKEKLRSINWIGICLAILAILSIAFANTLKF